jgi:hypothetical protein
VIAPVAVVLAITGIVSGCGGSGSSTDPISKADFVKQANAACAQTQKQIETEFAQFVSSLGGKEPSSQQANEAAQTKVANEILIPGKEQELDSLKELGAPKGDKEQVDEITSALEEGIEETKKDPGHAASNSGKTFAKEQTLAARYGLKNC